ncbi:hypothetical protein SAMN04487948_13318 [Halogranum amylolyticum]|uniref:DUF6788 domain-containing protein n=1 Tax=Halogranum amylolyticum TaxID=660520 RepID=A0A1H8WL64_9EURY|nr:hypothetical protein [Halogranum amylolyticum]SEP28434.1 hypothetical protein SAMN04487948_13318 [Halogranum amylolyticum]
MSDSPPTPPQDVPSGIAERLTDQSQNVLRDIARYADELAEHREREARLAEQDERSEAIEAEADDLPDGVPGKATITVKEINDHRYYYWQWREGDQVKSKYKGPVESDE